MGTGPETPQQAPEQLLARQNPAPQEEERGHEPAAHAALPGLARGSLASRPRTDQAVPPMGRPGGVREAPLTAGDSGEARKPTHRAPRSQAILGAVSQNTR